jgi:Leucine-rich repeat (LRR) protein
MDGRRTSLVKSSLAAAACCAFVTLAGCEGVQTRRSGAASGKRYPVLIGLVERKSAFVRVNGRGAGRTPCSLRLGRGDRIEILAPRGFRITRSYKGERVLRFKLDGPMWHLSTVRSAEPDKQVWRIAAIDAGFKEGMFSLSQLLGDKKAGYVCVRLLSPVSAGAAHALGGIRSLELQITNAKNEDIERLNSFRNLSGLSLRGSTGVTDLMPIAGLDTLKHLTLDGCTGLEDIKAVAGLRSLKDLDLGGCKGVSDLAPVAGLPSLKSLNFDGLRALRDLTPLSSVGTLERLEFAHCPGIRDLSPLADLKGLRTLEIPYCGRVKSLAPLSSLESLKRLNIMGNAGITDLSPLAGLTSLESINMKFCNKVASLAPLAGMKEMTHLNAGLCFGIEELSPLAGVTSMESLDLTECGKITDLSPLAGLKALRRLRLHICGGVSDLRPLAKLTALNELDAFACPADIPALPRLKFLSQAAMPRMVTDRSFEAFCKAHPDIRRLGLASCEHLTDLSPVGTLTSLEAVNMNDCPRISDMTPLVGLEALDTVSVEGCKEIKDVSALLRIKGLRSVALPPGLTNEQLEAVCDTHPRLTTLGLKWCRRVADITPVGSLSFLRRLSLKGCREVRDLKPLHSLKRLRFLDVRECPRLKAAHFQALKAALPGCRVRTK